VSVLWTIARTRSATGTDSMHPGNLNVPVNAKSLAPFYCWKFMPTMLRLNRTPLQINLLKFSQNSNHFFNQGHKRIFIGLLFHPSMCEERSLILDYSFRIFGHFRRGLFVTLRVAVVSAKNHERRRRERQSVTAKREKSQTPNVLTAILTLPNLT